jgi:exonuclease SbcC
VSEDQLDELLRAADKAAQLREESQVRLSAKIVERERCRADAGDQDPSPDVERLTVDVAQAQSAVQELPRHEAACEHVQQELDQARTGLSVAEVNLAIAAERIDDLTTAIAASEAIIDAARADFDTVADRSRNLTNQISAAQQWARSRAQVEALDQSLTAVSQALDAAARDAGCRDSDEARAAIRDPANLRASTERIVEYERLCAVNAAALAVHLDSDPEGGLPDMHATAQRQAIATVTADEARARLTSTQSTVKEVSLCAAAIASAAQSIVAVNAKAAPTIRVADALGGLGRVNSRRMTLSTYVLRERFASVVDAASRRLDRMSDGRYVMERDEAVTGNRRAGLGLVVLDQWNGSRRDPRTLSGGESFYASLSLALGLADVVRDEVGGVELETLFIDEGFGSLDPQTLESVLGVIDSLRDGGRVVGIVSHVNELKERIPDRIEVRRRADGTSTVSIRAT